MIWKTESYFYHINELVPESIKIFRPGRVTHKTNSTDDVAKNVRIAATRIQYTLYSNLYSVEKKKKDLNNFIIVKMKIQMCLPAY